jgi:hypothetical protein
MGRVLLGSGTAFIIAFVVLKTINKPLKQTIKELKRKAPSGVITEPEKDTEILNGRHEIQNKKKSLEIWFAKLEALMTSGNCRISESGMEIIGLVDSLAASEKLRLLRRENMEEKQPEKKNNTENVSTEKKLTGEYRYRYEFAGRFRHILNFLNKAEKLPYFFSINSISILAEAYDKNGKPASPWYLRLSFIITIYYLKESTG